MKRTLLVVLLLLPTAAGAASVVSLARCSTAVFGEIGRTKKWSGKAPAGCPPGVAVERDAAGIVVTVWQVEEGRLGWVETSFSAEMGYGEVAAAKELARGKNDIMGRARHLDSCLQSLREANDPLDCRRKGSRDYVLGEESGVEDREALWLPDSGRACLVQYVTGDTSATPSAPFSMSEGEPLPPGVNIDIFLEGGRRVGRGRK